MGKFTYTVPLMRGSNKKFEVHDENSFSRAKIQRYYPNLLHRLTELFLTGWVVNLIVSQDEKEYLIKEHFHWFKNEWSILDNGVKIGTLTKSKKIEFGDTLELVFKGKKFYYYDKPFQTQTLFQDEEKNNVAIIDYKLFDLSRQSEIVIFSNELPVSLLVGIDYASYLKN